MPICSGRLARWKKQSRAYVPSAVLANGQPNTSLCALCERPMLSLHPMSAYSEACKRSMAILLLRLLCSAAPKYGGHGAPMLPNISGLRTYRSNEFSDEDYLHPLKGF